MREPDNIRQVAETGINWMGFIFYPQSPRCLRDDGNGEPLSSFISQLSTVNCRLKKVGVFVNATQEEIMETAARYRLDFLQLHGNESPDSCYALHKRGYAVIKAFSIATEEDLKPTADYEGRADYFLFDTPCSGYGGSGKQFDWPILSAYKGQTPFLLSGGINPGSAEALRNFSHPRLAGIDLNSGFETKPGIKDATLLKVFVDKIKSIWEI